MKLKVISDGTLYGTTIVNAETGEILENVTGLTWAFEVTGPGSTAKISVRNVPIEAAGEAQPRDAKRKNGIHKGKKP